MVLQNLKNAFLEYCIMTCEGDYFGLREQDNLFFRIDQFIVRALVFVILAYMAYLLIKTIFDYMRHRKKLFSTIIDCFKILFNTILRFSIVVIYFACQLAICWSCCIYGLFGGLVCVILIVLIGTVIVRILRKHPELFDIFY